jgi:hypothetical protein
MEKIEIIKGNRELALSFLKESFNFFNSLMIEEEINSRKKMITGCGVNKYDFPLFLKDSFLLNRKGKDYEQEIYERWVLNDRIFKYRNQLVSIIGKYEYLINSKGI